VFRKELRSWSVPFPPFPASHGCVRVPAPEARGVYEFASLGTAVVVYRAFPLLTAVFQPPLLGTANAV
jgi:hypothetical protein